NPVEGAKVFFEAMNERPNLPGLWADGTGAATTDRDGKWAFDGSPEHPAQVMVDVRHPDYIWSSSQDRGGIEEFDLLKSKALVTIIRRGVSVAGQIVDEQNRPI